MNKKLFATIFTSLFISLLGLNLDILAQNYCYCGNHTISDTKIEKTDSKDTCILLYQDKQVGYLTCETTKEKGMPKKSKNIILDNDKRLVAYLVNEAGQFVIKYTDPYKVVYVKGMNFNNAIKQMVENDQRLKFKEE